MLNYGLKTPYVMDNKTPLKEYPRPTLVRNSFINLNGMWDLEISLEKKLPKHYTKKICVPYVIESALSNVRMDLDSNQYLIYRLNFEVKKGFINDVSVLHFDGVNQVCDVYFNDILLGNHKGMALGFSFDVSNLIKLGENTIEVIVENSCDQNYELGKEAHKRGGMWYTKVSGIYKTVWLESYSSDAILKARFESHNDGHVKCDIESSGTNFNVEIKFENKVIKSLNKVGKSFEFDIENPHLWNLDEPNLYQVNIWNKNDKVETYFAFRSFEAKNGKFYLNDKEIFINGLLDQGYYSDGIYTPASYDAYQDDILRMKDLGFNTLRKHIKVESEYFYYLADKLGMLIFQDFPNSGRYSFYKNGVLAVMGVRFNDKKTEVCEERRNHFINTGKGIIDFCYSHPSVVYYTIFNEGWGQFDSDNMYDYFKALDESRVFDSTSGWFSQEKSDVNSIHIYMRKVNLPKEEKNRPIILSEFGGYSLIIKDHVFNDSKNSGYKDIDNKEELETELVKLYERDVIGLKEKGLAGAIYTQVSDVEDETNGLLTYDRQVLKVDPIIMRNLFLKLK